MELYEAILLFDDEIDQPDYSNRVTKGGSEIAI
jgi:hypothetical protein